MIKGLRKLEIYQKSLGKGDKCELFSIYEMKGSAKTQAYGVFTSHGTARCVTVLCFVFHLRKYQCEQNLQIINEASVSSRDRRQNTVMCVITLVTTQVYGIFLT